MVATASAAELAGKLREISESIRRSMDAPPAVGQPTELLPVLLDEFHRLSQRAAHQASLIGQLNPRPDGAINDLIQGGKRRLARMFDWMLRPQREYNRAMLEALDSLAVALEQSRAPVLAGFQKQDAASQKNAHDAGQLSLHLRELSETATRQIERNSMETRELVRELRWSYEGALSRHITSVDETRRKLNEGIRELNRRLAAQAKAATTRPQEAILISQPATSAAPSLGSIQPTRPLSPQLEVDYFALEKDFRGTEEEIRERQSYYLSHFQRCTSVLDIACGRGEFLELMKGAGVPATGVDLDADMVGRCLEKGLSAVQADVFAHLAQIVDGSLDGIFCSQFVEHLDPADYTHLVLEAVRKLAPGGVLAIETQNPECLAIFSQSFYIDPTHVRPIPAAQMRYLFTQAGLEDVTTHYLSPASAHLPVLPELTAAADSESIATFNKAVQRFNATFFGGMDYGVIGRKPGGK